MENKYYKPMMILTITTAPDDVNFLENYAMLSIFLFQFQLLKFNSEYYLLLTFIIYDT